MMLIQFSQHIGTYLHEVFITSFDGWVALGLIGQLLFAARFIVQWIASERAGRSVVPLAFWFFSIGGAGIVLAYGIHKRDAVIIFGQSLSFLIYFRNLALIARERRERGKVGVEGG